ncbi:hypothetical protein [Microbacterium sp. GXF6406]
MDETEGYELTIEQQADIDAVVIGTDDDAETFDADVAREAGADEEAIADYAIILADAGWTIHGDYTAEAAGEVASKAVTACTGVTQYNGYFFPIGFQWALNSCDTDTFIAALKVIVAGGGATAAVALLTKIGAPVAAVAAAVGGLAALGVAVTELCKTASPQNAIYLNSGGTVPPSCWGQ